jgi:hypothetical protein
MGRAFTLAFDLESLVKRVVELEKEIFLLRKVAKAAKWQAFYHPEDTIEMVENSLTDLQKEFPHAVD